MSYIICGYHGVGKSTYAHNYGYAHAVKHKRGYTPRIIYNFEELDTGDLALSGLDRVYSEKDDSVILLPLNESIVSALYESKYPFAEIFPDLRMAKRWEGRLSPYQYSTFEEDCAKWKKDKRSTTQFIIKDPENTGMTGWMVDSIILMMDRKLQKMK